MSRTVHQLLEEQSAALVGRDVERAVLRQLLGDGGPLVVFVHGIAGIGKSTLIEAFAAEARADGATVLRLDCRSIEPTERGLLAALAERTGSQAATVIDAVERLGGLGKRVVLMLDTYELFRILDPWLRQAFVPTLPDNVRVVLSGRESPMTGWPSSMGRFFRGVALDNLARADAEALLERAGVDHGDAAADLRHRPRSSALAAARCLGAG